MLKICILIAMNDFSFWLATLVRVQCLPCFHTITLHASVWIRCKYAQKTIEQILAEAKKAGQTVFTFLCWHWHKYHTLNNVTSDKMVSANLMVFHFWGILQTFPATFIGRFKHCRLHPWLRLCFGWSQAGTKRISWCLCWRSVCVFSLLLLCIKRNHMARQWYFLHHTCVLYKYVCRTRLFRCVTWSISFRVAASWPDTRTRTRLDGGVAGHGVV